VTPDEPAQYRELAVFAEDVATPGEVVARRFTYRRLERVSDPAVVPAAV